MPFTFNGIGTTYYGARDFLLDGTYTTTEWIVFVYFPIIPLRSLRISESNERTDFVVYSSRKYYIHSKGRPNLRQVLSVYGWLGALFYPAILAPFIPALDGNLWWIAGVVPVAFLPHLLRKRAIRRMVDGYKSSIGIDPSNR
jgi:hypothetical protein